MKLQNDRCRNRGHRAGGAGVGIGHIFGNYLAGALRNPAAAAGQRGTLFLGFAFAEATGLIGFAVAMLILFS